MRMLNTSNGDVDVALPLEKCLRTPMQRAWGHFDERFRITGVRNTAERSFGKLRLLKTFLRSTMIDAKLANLEMIYLENETSKALDMTDLTERLHFETGKSHFPSLKYSKSLRLSPLHGVLMLLCRKYLYKHS